MSAELYLELSKIGFQAMPQLQSLAAKTRPITPLIGLARTTTAVHSCMYILAGSLALTLSRAMEK